MNWFNAVTIIGGTVLTVLPQVISLLPSQPERNAATAIIAAIVSIWHLYQPSPSAK